LARFVSPDPFIQSPGNPQNFNRYSYTINSPQIYIDPSGHFFGFIFSLIFNNSTANKLWAASDPFGFILSKIPKKVNAGLQIFGGVVMMLTGNPQGAVYIAQGALSFGKGTGFQIASQVLGAVGAAAMLAGGGGTGPDGGAEAGCGLGCDYPSEGRSGGGDWLGGLLAANSLAAGGRVPVQVGSRPVAGGPAEHKLIRFPGQGQLGGRILEAGPDANYDYALYDTAASPGTPGVQNRALPDTARHIIRHPDQIKWSETSIDMSRFETALQTWRAEFVGRPWPLQNSVFLNSNHFVNYVISNAGGDPRVPGAFAPACTPQGCSVR